MKHRFYFYTYNKNDDVRIQQKRILGYSVQESIIVDSLWSSVFMKKICDKHENYWNEEWCRINNFKHEFERQKLIEKDNKKDGKICCVCNYSFGVLYETTTQEYIHSECIKG